MTGHNHLLEVKPVIPAALADLACFAKDLLYSCHADIRNLFIQLDKQLWEDCGHSPTIFLRRIQQEQLDLAASNDRYLEEYHRVQAWYNDYQKQGIDPALNHLLDPQQDLIAYFCSEFGFHESLPIYSGGLGILAGDHCKAASDLGIPFVAVGLLYHQGYFTQTIDPDGQQVASNITQYFGYLPITLLKDDSGEEIHISIHLLDHPLTLRIWQVKVRHVKIYLLDSDVASNSEEDRKITLQLYGSGHDIRIKQEIILGIGGVSALRKLGLKPNIWHINEGHAAFQILARCIEFVEQGLNFNAAMELVAGSTVFTTHTPVSAGHDSFPQQTMVNYFSDTARQLSIDFDKLLALGLSPEDPHRFNMTSLALRGSRFHNGVSKIHGKIASAMEQHIWPEIPVQENPVISITNGVHLPSILAKKWTHIFDTYCHDWQDHLLDINYWQCIDKIPDAAYWETHQTLKTKMLDDVCHRLHKQHQRNESSKAFQEASICHMKQAAGDILVFGFARRFATYKRATLLFSDIDRLTALLNNPQRPIMIIFAGKAHPSDEPGQQLIREIHQFSERPEFVGKIILLEGYDLALGRRMISGTDVWLNTPTYPMEACGTSGQKAAINGVINLSVMDGWWAEGYNGENGWAIQPHTDKYGAEYRNQQEASDLLDTIENQVIPAYFERNSAGIPSAWLAMSKAAMKSTITQFNAKRMLQGYIEKLYASAKKQHQKLSAHHYEGAKSVADWKARVSAQWPGVSMYSVDGTAITIDQGNPWSIGIGVHLNGLQVEDIIVECLYGYEDGNGKFCVEQTHRLSTVSKPADHNQEIIYTLNIQPAKSGLYHYKLRMYPYNPLLSHRFETGLMRWL